jgi:hypothetical protein
MDSFDKSATKAIKKKLVNRLGRKLTDIEEQTFSMVRSGIAYEMIMDYISDMKKSKEDIESYVINVAKEYQDHLSNE